MISSRIIWTLCIIGAILFFIFSDSYLSLAVLTLVVVLPLILIVVNQMVARRLTFSLSVPVIAEKKKAFTCSLKATNKRAFALSPVMCKLSCKNIFTGEMLTSRVMFPVGGKKSFTVPFMLASDYCGGVQIAIEQARVYDAFGLFATSPATDARAVSTVLPNTFMPQLTVLPNLSKDLEADEYSQTKPGADPSETFAIRDYRAGDSLKQIHWKLTCKFDRLMIKEAGLPVRHSFLVLLETSLPEGFQADAELSDALGEIVISLCQTLAEEQISFDLAWYDHLQEGFFTYHINTPDDLTSIIERLLCAYEAPNALDAFAGYTEAFGVFDYEHLMYISRFLPQENITLAEDGRTTAIICTHDVHAVSAALDSTVQIYLCSPENYEHELSNLEI